MSRLRGNHLRKRRLVFSTVPFCQGAWGSQNQLSAPIPSFRRCQAENSVPQIARNLRRRQDRPGNVWHLDEVVVKIAGRSFWLWRAVDQHGVVLDEILQTRRDKRAARRLLVKLLKRLGFGPKRIVTDKLRSYGAAKREVAPGLTHWSHKGLNNRAEHSHLPFRKRERGMQSFRSPGGLQRFVSVHSATRNCFSAPFRRRAALTIRYHRLQALDAWKAAANIA